MRNIFTLLLLCWGIYHSQAQNTPTQWDAAGSGGGGAVYSPSISPHQSNECYLSCDMSVMSHSIDFGLNWRTISFDTLAGFRSSKVNFTNHPDTLYVLGFDRYTSKSFPYMSTDRGKNWKTLQSNSYWGSFGCFKVFADPNDAKKVLVSTYTAIYFSSDYGNTFTNIHSASNQGASKLHLAGVFFTNDSIFVSTDQGMIIYNGKAWGSYTSYNNMSINTSTEAVVSFNGAQHANSAPRFYCSTISSSKIDPRTEPRDMQYFQKLYTIDYGQSTSWNNITNALKNADGTATSGNVCYQITMLPQYVDTLYITGQTTVNGQKFGTIYKTVDGGNNFTRVFLKNSNVNNNNFTTGWVGGSSYKNWGHSWVSINTVEGLCIDPHNIDRIMESDFSGVHTSTDGGNNWVQKYVDSNYQHQPGVKVARSDIYKTNGLQTTVCYWMEWLDSLNILSCYADLNMNISNDGGNTWSFDHDSLWSTRANDNHMIVRTSSGRIYSPTGEVMGNNGDFSDSRVTKANAGQLVYSDDGGHQWHLIKDFKTPVSWIALDPNDTSVLYVAVYSSINGNGGIYKCSNLPTATNWTLLSAPNRTEKRATQVFALKDGSIIALYGARDSTTSVAGYKYTQSSGIFLSTDKGQSWSDLTANYSGMQWDMRYIIPDPSDSNENTWYATVSNNGVGSVPGLYRTTDRGNTWKSVYNTLRMLTVTFNPYSPTEMYICSERDGLFYATKANTDSIQVTSLPEYPFRSPQRVFFNPYKKGEVWVTSIGNGLRVGNYKINTPLPTQLLSFTGTSHDSDNILDWATATEYQSDYFGVEHSVDGTNFIEINQTKAAGNSSQLKNYSYTHQNVPYGNNYYRLKIYDLNGKYTYSNVVILNRKQNTTGLQIIPIPSHGLITLHQISTLEKPYQVYIYSITGQLIKSINNNLYQNAVFDVKDIPSGCYIVRIIYDAKEQSIIVPILNESP